MNSKTFIIIDGNAIIHRAYHALPPLTKDGVMVNAVYGFSSMLLKVLDDFKPDYLAVSFDVAKKTFRNDVYKEYKATRVKADQELYDQIPLVHDVVRAFNIPILIKEGFEADDVIGTACWQVKNLKSKVKSVVVTGDMDMLQLVDDDIVDVYLLKKGVSEFELYNEAKVKERFGFGPGHIIDYKSLRGDSSDNIPGIKGIGEKTAGELISKFGTIDEIYGFLEKDEEEFKKLVKPAVFTKIKQGKQSAFMSQELATIRQDVPDFGFDLDKCVVSGIDYEKVKDIFRRFGFTSLLKRVDTKDKMSGGKRQIINPKSEIQNPKHSVQNYKTKPIEIKEVKSENLKSLISEIEKEKIFVCKEILNGSDILTCDCAGLLFLVKEEVYFFENNLPEKELKNSLSVIFENKDLTIVGHDLKELVKACLSWGIKVQNNLFDIMIASYLINSSERSYDLESILFRELELNFATDDKQASLFGINKEELANKLSYLLEIYNKYNERLKDLDDQGLFNKVEMALVPVLAGMEMSGVALDKEKLAELSKEVNQKIKELTNQICKEAGEEFNVSSSVQLRDILFEKLKLPTEGIKKGKTGLSTAAPELEKLRGTHPIIEMIEEYREVTKLQNTYIDVLPGLINKKTDRLHTHFNQAVTTTGRLSSSDPNLQNIPIRTEMGRKIRESFVSESGNFLVVADYSQIELRIVASLAEDKKMIEIFNKGEDIHKATAAAIHGVNLDKVTKEMRYAAKEINFGVLYGMGSYGLSWRAGIPQWQAKEFIKKYFEQFSGVKKYLDQTLEFARKEGYVETLFGRRRYIPELKATNFQLRNSGERMAINMPVQGTAADVMKMAMIALDNKLKVEFNQNTDVKLILQVHDELVLEVKKGLEERVSKIVKSEMENVAKLRVPIEVHVGVGTRWGELK